MNSLELLQEEKSDVEASHALILESINRLNLARDYDLIKSLEKSKKQFENHLTVLEEQIEKTKQSIDGLVESKTALGYIITAKRDNGKDVFLRLRFFEQSFKNSGDWNDSIHLDWTEKIEESCFINYEKFSSMDKSFTEEVFRDVYKHCKKSKGLENGIKQNSIKKKTTEKEDKVSYIFKD